MKKVVLQCELADVFPSLHASEIVCGSNDKNVFDQYTWTNPVFADDRVPWPYTFQRPETTIYSC
jgi:hypothetical protein